MVLIDDDDNVVHDGNDKTQETSSLASRWR